MEIGVTGTASFQDCSCPSCAGGRTRDEASLPHAPTEGLDPRTLSRRAMPTMNEHSPWSEHKTLPTGHSYMVEEREGRQVLLRRPVIMSKANDGGGDAAYQAETNRLRAINQRNTSHYGALAADPRRALMGR